MLSGMGRTLADKIKSDPARWGSIALVALASAGFAAWLLYFSRQQWFVTDEFDYFNFRGEPLIIWLLRPHNEHTIVFTKAWFALLGNFVGLRHYFLYMIPIVACHLVVVAAIYRLTWRSTRSRVITTGVALVSLAMGAAVGTLTWAGQLQYVGSVAAGLIVVSLAIESSGRRALAIVIVAAIFGTLNGSAFVAFGLAAAIVYGRRRLWTEALAVAAIPLGWEVINRLVWAPADPYAATGLGQILDQGPSFAYAILDTAISQTLHETHLSSVVLAALVLGTLTLLSLDLRWRRTAMSGRIVAALALAATLTMFSLIVARLSLPVASWNGGGYSYLFLASLVPVGGILLSHIARSRAALLGVGTVFLAISLMGVGAFHANAAGLQTWKTNGGHLLQTAAAELNAGMPTLQDQIPAPDTAPTVTQERLRALAASGQLDATIVGPVEADQASLNMQWRLVPASQAAGSCRDLTVGESFPVPVGTVVSMAGLSPGAAVDLQYTSTSALRQFPVPSTSVTLQTVSQRPAVATVAAASVRVCMPNWG
jgi:hypothetical protein